MKPAPDCAGVDLYVFKSQMLATYFLTQSVLIYTMFFFTYSILYFFHFFSHFVLYYCNVDGCNQVDYCRACIKFPPNMTGSGLCKRMTLAGIGSGEGDDVSRDRDCVRG